MTAKRKIADELLSKLGTFSSLIDGKDKNWIKNLVQQSCDALLSDTDDKGFESPQLMNVVICILVESAKYDYDGSDLSGQLSKAKSSQILNESILDIYNVNKQKLRTKLSKVGWHHPRIIDCDWKLDYQIKSNAQEEIDRPNFTLDLKIVQSDKPQDVSDFKFQCSSEQIQDLLWKLKEASKFVEKIAYQ